MKNVYPREMDLTHWPLGIWLQSHISKFQTHFNDKYLKYLLWNCFQVNATTPHWSLVNIGSGNGLVPSGSKPFLSQYWRRSLSPYKITGSQWVKDSKQTTAEGQNQYLNMQSRTGFEIITTKHFRSFDIKWNAILALYDYTCDHQLYFDNLVKSLCK